MDRLNAMELGIDLEEDEEEESDNGDEQPGEPFINWNTDESDEVWMSQLRCLLCQPSERRNCFEEWHKSLQEGENSESA